jgi:ABC-type phosphate/phosphonate transport system substrate-binding protein
MSSFGSRLFGILAGALVILLVLAAAHAAGQQQAKPDVLNIGSSGTLTSGARGVKDDAALKTLQIFIKTETGLNNEIHRQTSWRELATKLTTGELQLGMMQGHEFAWADEEHPTLKALAVAVNVYVYPVVYVVSRKDEAAKGFAGLKGKSLALAAAAPSFMRLYIERECRDLGTKSDAFFSKTHSPENVEDAIDDVVDGKVGAAAIDRAALEGYKRRKPGRFKQLTPVAQSEPLPPPVLAYQQGNLDATTLQRFRDGLLNANKKEKGKMMLTLFHLTRFDPLPADFDKVLTQTRKRYPPTLDPGK